MKAQISFNLGAIEKDRHINSCSQLSFCRNIRRGKEQSPYISEQNKELDWKYQKFWIKAMYREAIDETIS